jgi:hypothetical protein
LSPQKDHSRAKVIKTIKLISLQIIKEFPLQKEEITPGKNKISSKSKRTNKIAKKKKGVLTERFGVNLSNPDSKGVKLSLFKALFLDRKTCTKRTPTNKNNKIKVIIIITL